ncbi:hypothetical protein OU787_23650 [Kitasatospora sp. YST-16]|nr:MULTISPECIES: hypothetical protein [unclassified Kitasatospora]WAL74226.1 hypothetical protein OU787_23650 [Kitasatospora sp. YST-16]WNW40294.1 hypothetical protein RKE32_23600 [Streptomyces sp. Li-HN-5-13]
MRLEHREQRQMAIRKSTMQEQVAAAIAAIEPNDRPVTTFHTVTGPSPWLTQQFGLIGQLFVKYYFVTLTHRVVVIHRASRVSNRPLDLLHVIPLDQARASISDVRRNTLWSSLRFQIPGEPQPTRLNIHRYWRTEMDAFTGGLLGGGPGVPGQYPQAQAPVPGQYQPAPGQAPYPQQAPGQAPYPPAQAPGQYPAPGANPYQS